MNKTRTGEALAALRKSMDDLRRAAEECPGRFKNSDNNFRPRSAKIHGRKTMNKPVRIKYERVLENGEPMIRVTSIRGMWAHREMPRRYERRKERIYGGKLKVASIEKTIQIAIDNDCRLLLAEGKIYAPRQFRRAMKLVRRHVNILDRVRRQLEREARAWSGAGSEAVRPWRRLAELLRRRGKKGKREFHGGELAAWSRSEKGGRR